MLIVHFLLRLLYRAVTKTGFLSTRPGRRIYAFIYEGFKVLTEKKDINIISRYIKPGAAVIDVGANIGFHTKFFLKLAGSRGKVVSFEPDKENLKTLKARFSGKIKSGNLVVIEKVATNQEGDYFLNLDASNPGGHKVGSKGTPVKGTTVDQTVSQLGIKPSFMKIDVEGHEEFVILGAEKTINRYHPVIFMEFHPRFLSDYGTSPLNLLQNFLGYGYKLFLFAKNEKIRESSVDEIIAQSTQRGWKDILLIPKGEYA